jgi:hypothetical protein
VLWLTVPGVSTFILQISRRFSLIAPEGAFGKSSPASEEL